MSFKRVGILLGKEFRYGFKGYIFIFSIVAPIVISVMVTLIFGGLFSEKAVLGIYGEDNSQVIPALQKVDSLSTREYGSVSELQQAVKTGAVDMGIVLPVDFDSSISGDISIELTGYLWGESLAKDRITINTALTNVIREMAGQESPVIIETINLGDEASVPWDDRLLPFIVLMAIFLGGLMVPATSLINEKNKKTLDALVVTPTTIGDVFASKGLLGLLMSLFMGILILIINQAFGGEPALLVLTLILGGIMAVEIGLILGISMKDFATLFAVWKFGGIILFAPVFIYLFPEIPGWIGRIFPTYYIIQPIVDISQRGGGWSDIFVNVVVLIGINVVLFGLVALSLRKTQQLGT